MKFMEGQQVKQGETIMMIDPRPYKAALDQAKGTLAHDEALLKDAQAQYKRYKALYEAGVVSKETMEADEAARGSTRARLNQTRQRLKPRSCNWIGATIQSPINGRIGLRLVDPGNIITANTTNLVIINQFQPIAVYFTLPENELPQVLHKLAAERRLPVDAYDRGDTQKLATGYLLTADNQIDTTTGTDKLKAVFDNDDAVAVSEPVCEYPPGTGGPAECAGGAIGGDSERASGIVCVGGGYGREGQGDGADPAGEGGAGGGAVDGGG